MASLYKKILIFALGTRENPTFLHAHTQFTYLHGIKFEQNVWGKQTSTYPLHHLEHTSLAMPKKPYEHYDFTKRLKKKLNLFKLSHPISDRIPNLSQKIQNLEYDFAICCNTYFIV